MARKPMAWPEKAWRVYLEAYFDVLPDGCWQWRGKVHKSGYGTISPRPPEYSYIAARAVWETYVGPIPPRRWLLRVCDNSLCVAPDHRRIATASEHWHWCRMLALDALAEKRAQASITSR